MESEPHPDEELRQRMSFPACCWLCDPVGHCLSPWQCFPPSEPKQERLL